MRINRHDMNPNDYAALKSIQRQNHNYFLEQQHGGRKKLIVESKLIASTVVGSVDLEKLNKRQFASFLGMFNRNLYKMLRERSQLLTLKIPFKGVSRSKNNKLYNSLPAGALFYNIDLSSAYWQIAHKLGYISTSIFNKYQNEEKYKSVKRLCISFLARPNKMTYHFPDGLAREISCDISCLKQVYDNIRNELYKTISTISDDVNYVEYNIDGISVLPEDKNTIKQYFKDQGLEYKTTICVKINDYEYRYGSRVKNWRKKVNLSNK